MRGTAGTVLLGILAALPALAGVVPEATEDRHETLLAPDGRIEIVSLTLERPASHEITCENKRLTIRAVPGGMMQLVGADVIVTIEVRGTRGSQLSFELIPGERASIWPMRRLEVHGEPDKFAVKAIAADWAFVVRADEVIRARLRVRCDDIPCTLSEGQRLDVDREGKDIVFRVISEEWPGRLVEAPEPTPEEERREVRAVAAEEAPPALAPPLPLVVTGWVAWEVKPLPPASP